MSLSYAVAATALGPCVRRATTTVTDSTQISSSRSVSSSSA